MPHLRPAPDAAVVVATVRALKAHSGKYKIVAGKPLPEDLLAENPDDVLAGAANLRKQIENVRICTACPRWSRSTRSPTDHPSEHDAIRAGRRGGRRRVRGVHRTSPTAAGARPSWPRRSPRRPTSPASSGFLYPDTPRLKEKIETVAHQRLRRRRCRLLGRRPASSSAPTRRPASARLPVCIAKTHLSISSDPSLKGAPTGWTLPVREVRASVGAGFIYPICGDMRTMPGLGTNPAAARIDLDENGEIVGLS